MRPDRTQRSLRDTQEHGTPGNLCFLFKGSSSSTHPQDPPLTRQAHLTVQSPDTKEGKYIAHVEEEG